MGQDNLRKFYWVATVLGIILLGLIAWFALDLRHLYRSGALRPAITRATRHSRPMLSSAQIQDWMTFRYINYVFRLPPEYLSQTLKISDAYYPNLVIGTYAASHKLNGAAFLQSVKQAVEAFPLGGAQ